jgi:UDP-GlcNAc:undecaprenyl-phosphate GlcNAc-1-phosphate transferase
MLTYAIIIFITSFAVSAAMTLLSRRFAIRMDLVARPKADRYHQRIVALGGGIGIFTTLAVAMLSAMGLALAISRMDSLAPLADRVGLDPQDFLARCREWGFLLLSMLILFAMGLWDDFKGLEPGIKLVIQFVVALMAATLADVRVEFFIHHRLATSLMSAVWIVLLINVFNFLDNMDGATTGIAAIVSSILLVSAVQSGQILISGLALVFIGTLLGFLLFNFPPATIFMGDAGSLVIGFLVAVLSLRTTYYQQSQTGPWYPVLVPLLALAVPLYDFVSVMSLRLSQGKSPFVGDTQHFSHRLKRHGLTDRQTALTLYLATLCTGLGATFLYQVNMIGALLILMQTLMILCLVAIFESQSPGLPGGSA